MQANGAQPAAGAQVAEVVEGGIASEVGLAPGDRIIEIDGKPVSDILDYQFRTFPSAISLRVIRPGGLEWQISIEKEEGEPLGISVYDEVFGQPRACENHCPFCFVSQLPPGLREPLYFKDDDLRLSVLHGNFITLTNLGAADWDRIREQHLSPLHVSIHTTDDRLRRRMLGNRAAPAVLEQLRELCSLGIEVHGQIVLCPGINDGEALERTLADLVAIEPPLASLAIVPVGVTRWAAPSIRAFTGDEARTVLAAIAPWQQRFASVGGGLWAADEWFIKAGMPLPNLTHYGTFPQLANGVGMARDFTHGFRLATRRLPASLEQRRSVALATGTLFAPLLCELARRFDAVAGLRVDVVPCQNDLFGGGVTVAGLLGGRDIIAGVQRALACGEIARPDLVLLPGAVLRDAGDVTLDDLSPADIAQELGMDVQAAGTPGELVRLVLGRHHPREVAQRR